MSSEYSAPHDVTNPSTAPATSQFDLAAVVQRGTGGKSRAPVWPPRPAHEVEAVVRHLIDRPKSVSLVAMCGLENPGPHTTAEVMLALGLSRRTIKSAHAVLLAEGMATRVDRWTRSGRDTTWIYDGVPLRDLTGDLGIVQIPRSERSWHRAISDQDAGAGPTGVTPEIARCHDQVISSLTCENVLISGVQREGHIIRDELISTRDVDSDLLRKQVSLGVGFSVSESRERETCFQGGPFSTSLAGLSVPASTGEASSLADHLAHQSSGSSSESEPGAPLDRVHPDTPPDPSEAAQQADSGGSVAPELDDVVEKATGSRPMSNGERALAEVQRGAPAPTAADLQVALSGQRVQRMTDEELAEDWDFMVEARQLMTYLDEMLMMRGMHIQPRWRNEYVNLFAMILVDGPVQDLHPHQADGYKIAWAIEELVIRLDRPYLFQLFARCLVDALERGAIKSSNALRWRWLKEQADLRGTRAIYDRVIKKGERSSWLNRINPPAPKPAFDQETHNAEVMRKLAKAAAARLAA